MLTDEQLINELRRAFAAETDDIDPRTGLRGRVAGQLEATSARRRFTLPAGSLISALGAAIPLLVVAAVIVLVGLHHGSSPKTVSAARPIHMPATPPAPTRTTATHITPSQVGTTVTPRFIIASRFCARYDGGKTGFLDATVIACDRGIPRGYTPDSEYPLPSARLWTATPHRHAPPVSGHHFLLITLTFVARLATSTNRQYSVLVDHAPTCTAAHDGVPEATVTVPAGIFAGARVEEFVVFESVCRGRYSGRVVYQLVTRDRLRSLLVGRFSGVVR